MECANVLQDEIEYWKAKAARLSLLVDQMLCNPTKITLVTLRAANCRLLKVQIASKSFKYRLIHIS